MKAVALTLALACTLGCSSGEDPRFGACRQDEVEACQALCDEGSAFACENLGFMYGRGRSVTADREKSRVAYERACELGRGHSCCAVALDHAAGRGVPQSRERAVEYAQRACAIGGTSSCCHHGQPSESFLSHALTDELP